jgi:5-oxoprolinase (ATP-hydrolysing)
MLEVEAIGATDAGAPPAPPEHGHAAPSTRVDIHGGGETRGPDLRRDDLPQGTRIDGPAIVSEASGTT